MRSTQEIQRSAENVAVGTEPEAEIRQWMRMLEKELHGLREDQDDLVKKLEPVMREQVVAQGKDGEEEQVCPLATELRHMTRVVERMRECIRDAHSRVEL